MSPTLDEAAAELYAVEPGRFTAERTRLTGVARAAGNSDTARAIGELRRPTTSAWLVNQLARDEHGAAEDIERLDQLGQDLREAQAALDAVRMRELTRQRHQLVGALVSRADEIAADAGQKVSAAVRRELEDTLGAAVADEQASLAVLSGRLTRALTYAGFGAVDMAEATATPLSSVHPYRARRSDADKDGGSENRGTHEKGYRENQHSGAMKRSDSRLAPRNTTRTAAGPGSATRTGTQVHRVQPGTESGTEAEVASRAETASRARAEKQAARRAQAEELVDQARAEVITAEEELRAKEHELTAATAERAELQTRLDALQAEVLATRRQLDAGDRRVSHAERDIQRHERHRKDVAKALDRAETALDRLDPP